MRHVAALLFVALLSIGLVCWTAPGRSEGSSREASPPVHQGKIYFMEGNRLSCIQPDGHKPSQFPRELSSLGSFQPYSARVAPDGRRLAFGLGEFRDKAMYPPCKIHVLDITKARGTELMVELPGTELMNWAWSPDGKKLAFSSWEARDRCRNWVVDVQTKRTKEIKLPKVKTPNGEVQLTVADWSPDQRFFVASGGGVYLVAVDGSKASRLTDPELSVYGGTCRFSPDGHRILFIGKEKGKNESLYVVKTSGGKPTAIVQYMNFSDFQACWSPDGRRIAYSFTFLDAKGKRGTESNLNVVDADGKNSATIASASHKSDEIKLLLIGWR